MEQKLSTLLGLPDVPVVVFERSPLVQTLCQVRYKEVLAVDSRAYVAPFQRAIEKQYLIEDNQPRREAGASDTPLWHFTDRDGTWRVVLAPDFLTIETRHYDSFADFLNGLKAVLTALTKHIRPAVITRIGLRYINEIRVADRDWSTVITPLLLGPLAEPALTRSVLQSVQQIVLRYPHNQGITIHHGHLPSGTAIAPRTVEKPPDGPFYLLDYDAFQEFPLPMGLTVERDRDLIWEYVEDYNQTIYKLFRWSVTPSYTASLGVRSHGGSRAG